MAFILSPEKQMANINSHAWKANKRQGGYMAGSDVMRAELETPPLDSSM